jgi:hypothetical protein
MPSTIRTGADLAEAFEAAAAEVIAAVDQLPEARWDDICPEEGWTYAVTAHHVAVGFELAANLVTMVASGQPLPPMTWDDVNEQNAAHATATAGISKPEVLVALRRKREQALEAVRALSEEQLSRVCSAIPLFGGDALSAYQVADMLLVGHPAMHAAGMRAVSG